MIIPVEELASDTLYSLVESFVLREGTDYGLEEVPLEEKVAQVIAQLQRGEAVILYSELHESVTIVPSNQLPPTEQEQSVDGS